VARLERFLDTNRTHVDLDASWDTTRPSGAPATLNDMLHYVRLLPLLASFYF
jgi:hypothetical protein